MPLPKRYTNRPRHQSTLRQLQTKSPSRAKKQNTRQPKQSTNNQMSQNTIHHPNTNTNHMPRLSTLRPPLSTHTRITIHPQSNIPRTHPQIRTLKLNLQHPSNKQPHPQPQKRKSPQPIDLNINNGPANQPTPRQPTHSKINKRSLTPYT